MRIEELVTSAFPEGHIQVSVTSTSPYEHRWVTNIVDPYISHPQDKERTTWYFEKHPKYPTTELSRADVAIPKFATYGESLFRQLFGDLVDFYNLPNTSKQGNATPVAGEISGTTWHCFSNIKSLIGKQVLWRFIDCIGNC